MPKNEKRYFVFDEYHSCGYEISSKNKKDVMRGVKNIMATTDIERSQVPWVLLLVKEADIEVCISDIDINIIPED
jgi:hypothetical protein